MAEIDDVKSEQLKRYTDILDFYKDLSVAIKRAYDQVYEKSCKQDYYKSYEEIVKRTADLCDSMKISTTPMLISLLYEYLLWGGYFSKGHRYAYDTNKRVCNVSCSGADIMRGKGVCLNNAEMLTRVYKELGMDAHTIGVSINKSIHKLNIWKPNIERIIDNNHSLISFISSLKLFQKLGNHAITIVKSSDIYEIYDPTGLAVLKPTDVLKACYMGTDQNFDLKIWLMIVLEGLMEDDNHHELSDIMSVLYAQGVSGVNRMIDLETYQDVCLGFLDALEDHENLLSDFHEKISDDIDIVSRTLSSERGRRHD